MLSAFHGLCMALADSVPGVSGGTIAFILGFYDDLLRALQGLFNGKGPVRRQSLRALLRFGIGWGVGMAACILALAELFELHVYFMCSLFLGLSAAAFPLVARAERGALRNTARYAPLALLGAALVVGLTLLREDAAVSLRVDFSELRVWPLLYLFVSGAIAVSAMILPGISGSTLLLIAGVYLPAMHALRQLLRLDFSGLPGILALGLGAAAGAGCPRHPRRAAPLPEPDGVADPRPDGRLTVRHRDGPRRTSDTADSGKPSDVFAAGLPAGRGGAPAAGAAARPPAECGKIITVTHRRGTEQPRRRATFSILFAFFLKM